MQSSRTLNDLNQNYLPINGCNDNNIRLLICLVGKNLYCKSVIHLVQLRIIVNKWVHHLKAEHPHSPYYYSFLYINTRKSLHWEWLTGGIFSQNTLADARRWHVALCAPVTIMRCIELPTGRRTSQVEICIYIKQQSNSFIFSWTRDQTFLLPAKPTNVPVRYHICE